MYEPRQEGINKFIHVLCLHGIDLRSARVRFRYRKPAPIYTVTSSAHTTTIFAELKLRLINSSVVKSYVPRPREIRGPKTDAEGDVLMDEKSYIVSEPISTSASLSFSSSEINRVPHAARVHLFEVLYERICEAVSLGHVRCVSYPNNPN